jgi:hypothetical protein
MLITAYVSILKEVKILFSVITRKISSEKFLQPPVVVLFIGANIVPTLLFYLPGTEFLLPL